MGERDVYKHIIDWGTLIMRPREFRMRGTCPLLAPCSGVPTNIQRLTRGMSKQKTWRPTGIYI